MTTVDDALGLHADSVLGLAWGRTLVLDDISRFGVLSGAVTETISMASGGVDGRFDTIVSIGTMANEPDLAKLLELLLNVSDAETQLVFCERTAVGDGEGHDITTLLWANGWSVIDCRRFRQGRGRRAIEYVWGRARPRPEASADFG